MDFPASKLCWQTRSLKDLTGAFHKVILSRRGCVAVHHSRQITYKRLLSGTTSWFGSQLVFVLIPDMNMCLPLCFCDLVTCSQTYHRESRLLTLSSILHKSHVLLSYNYSRHNSTISLIQSFSFILSLWLNINTGRKIDIHHTKVCVSWTGWCV